MSALRSEESEGSEESLDAGLKLEVQSTEGQMRAEAGEMNGGQEDEHERKSED